jgi:hypothetical protein
VRAHRGPGQNGAVDCALVEDGQQIVGQCRVAVGVRLGRGRRLAVSARVVGDDAMPVALQCARAHHHVAAGRGQPVQQHDRLALARIIARKRHGAGVDAQLCHPGRST